MALEVTLRKCNFLPQKLGLVKRKKEVDVVVSAHHKCYLGRQSLEHQRQKIGRQALPSAGKKGALRAKGKSSATDKKTT